VPLVLSGRVVPLTRKSYIAPGESASFPGRVYLADNGPEVRSLVLEVTDDKRLPKEERKRLQIEHGSRLSPKAKLIKLGDKIANVHDVTATPPASWSLERRREYLDWTEQAVRACRGSNPALELRYDEALRVGRALLEGSTGGRR
jgi:guanosine-3',5'-bis(diphosphate) 3'-pyrophosphohydrolase